jgi:hypothetical protein
VTPAELLPKYRRMMDDAVKPYLWSDEEVFEYFDAAQRKFCQLTQGIRDASSAACTVLISAGEAFSDLHPSIRRVRSAQLVSTGAELRLIELAQLGSAGLSFEPGTVRSGVLGVEDNKVRWDVVPEADDEARLVVFRGPLNTVDEGSVDTPLEVGDDYIDALLLWAGHLGYLKTDADTFDQRQADRLEARFYVRCTEIKRDQERRTYVARSVAYGGL